MNPTDWHAIAEAKLVRVLGDAEGGRAMREVLASLNLPAITTAAELALFAKHLARRGGFSAPVAAMLDVHVAIYGISA